MRTSSYVIYVDLPDNDDELLLVHGYSGAYDKVSRRVGGYLRSLEVGPAPKPLYGKWTPEPQVDGAVATPSDETIAVLTRRGYLTDLSVDDEIALFSRVADTIHRASMRANFIFMPTYDCNLRCSYCFQDHMRTDPSYRRLLTTMTRDTVDRIFASFAAIERRHGLPEGPQNRPTMGLFGGEPLLAESRDIVGYIIERAQRDGETTFWAITNGTDLAEYSELLNPQQLSAVQITIDGPPDEHDQRRIYADGSGSWSRIAPNISMALDQGVQVSMRMNIDRNNVGELPRLAEEIVRRGWDQYPMFNAYTAVIQASNAKTDRKSTFGTWHLNRALDQLRAEHPAMQVISKPDDPLSNHIQSIFNTSGLPAPRASYCGAHTGMYLFDAFGDIYTCWERTGDSTIRVGHLDEEGTPTFNDFVEKWQSRNVTTNPTCRRCRYALSCGGGCAVLAEDHRGEFFTNFCDGYASRFRASAAEAFERQQRKQLPVLVAGPGCDT